MYKIIIIIVVVIVVRYNDRGETKRLIDLLLAYSPVKEEEVDKIAEEMGRQDQRVDRDEVSLTPKGERTIFYLF